MSCVVLGGGRRSSTRGAGGGALPFKRLTTDPCSDGTASGARDGIQGTTERPGTRFSVNATVPSAAIFAVNPVASYVSVPSFASLRLNCSPRWVKRGAGCGISSWAGGGGGRGTSAPVSAARIG